MNISYNTEDIVRFINGQMSTAEVDAFQEAIQGNTALAEELEAQRKISRLVQIASIKQKLDSAHNEYALGETNVVPIKSNTKRPATWPWVLLAAAVVGIGLFLFLYQPGSSANDKIFARYFKDDVGTPSLMGNNATTFDDAMVYYKSADYRVAASKFEKLLSQNPKNDTAKYYDALCQVRLKQENKAIALLTSVSGSAGSELNTKAQWYIALVLIHQKRSKEAIVILKNIKINGPPVYAEKASAVLTILEPVEQKQ
jgi:tetratricopeptide (TPR) repeat protein